MNIFVSHYVNNYNYSELKLKEIVNNEIDKQLGINEILEKSLDCRGECARRWYKAKKRCDRNYIIGNAAVAISGFFTLGIGTIIGAASVGGVALLCANDARNDADDCYAKCDSETNNS